MSQLKKLKWCLAGSLIAIILIMASAWLMPAQVIGAIDWLSHIPSPARARTFLADSPAGQDHIVEMSLERVGLSGLEQQPVVLLKEKGGEERYLKVWIGLAEARAIAIVLQGVSPPRPLTHDLLQAAVESLGAKVRFILIDDLRDGIFYAKVVVNFHGKRIELDSRPSDALALALRTGSPIYAKEKLLEQTPAPGDIRTKVDM